MKILIINTLSDNKEEINGLLRHFKQMNLSYKVIETKNKKIINCMGCNECWLKTPGICRIKDDYVEVFKMILYADRVIILADTKLGFISYEAKNIIDRLMPAVTMNLHFVNGQMRHMPRYNSFPQLGLIYFGEANNKYLCKWLQRAAINFNTQSLGAYKINNEEELLKCI